MSVIGGTISDPNEVVQKSVRYVEIPIYQSDITSLPQWMGRTVPHNLVILEMALLPK